MNTYSWFHMKFAKANQTIDKDMVVENHNYSDNMNH